MKWIEVSHLEQWAGTIGSRTALSEVVGALVRATASDINSFEFPTGDSAQAPGYDGILKATGVDPYIPDGESVWEFGTEKDYVGKANKDYKTRCTSPLSAVPSETTFVFVTPRHWKGGKGKLSLEEWEKNKTAEGKWKAVRVVYGVKLEDWLEACPAVAARMAREVLQVMPANGARSTDEFWEEYSSRFKPSLNEQVLVCDREEQAGALRQQLVAGAPGAYLWQADSLQEAVAFAVAAIRRAEDGERKFLQARTLVLDTEDAARQLARNPNLIFLARAGALDLSGLLANNRPTVVPLGRPDPRRGTSTLLERPTRYALAKALEMMGYSPEDALLLARKCGRSVTILARQIPSASVERPPWDGRQELVPALVAGAWDAKSEEDRKIVQALAGTATYEEYEGKLLPYVRMEDPPLERVGQVWNVRAPVDAFVHLAYLLGREHLERMEKAFGTVFSEHDPSLDLRSEERPYAALNGKTLKHSNWLRDGLATTLLLFAALHDEAGLTVPEGPHDFVDRLIRELPGLNQDWRLLASLGNRLPLLMEAAPRPLLAALERLLEGDGSRIRPIFSETEGALFPSSAHTGLLWALEVMAWDPEYLSRVSLILAGLARIDPGGKLANRPISSLCQIFLAWHPCTNASLRQRLGVLDQLITQEPAIAWELILTLLPAYHSVAQPTARPLYREAGASEREVLTNQLVWQGYKEAIQRALNLAGDDPQRWASLVEAFPHFDPSDLDRACRLLEEFGEHVDAGKRTVVWSALSAFINKHKAFRQAAWAMDKSRIERLERVTGLLQPVDSIVRVAWLFNDVFPMLPDADPERGEADIEKARGDALREVSQSGGVSAIISLANQVTYPRIVAASVSKSVDDIGAFDSMIDASLGQGPNLDEFAVMLSAEAERRFKQEWNTRILSRLHGNRCTLDGVAALLLLWPDEPETWTFVASIGPDVERSYWQRKQAWPLKGTTEALEVAARKYLSVGRAVAALGALHRAADRISHEVLFALLDKAVEEINSSPNLISNMLNYELGVIFDGLDRRQDIAKIEIARREYAYLPLLEHGDRRLTLHRMMADDPEFFVSVLCDVFRPAADEATEPTEVGRARARAAYSLLSKFCLVPGQQRGEIDPAVLSKWVGEVRESAARHDRAQIADQYIGHTLAHAPTDTDGGWPHRAVRDIIEAVNSDDTERGIKVERLNMRGAFTKAMYEGGNQERGLAEQARTWAKVAVKWPRTHAMLLDIARMWDESAEREDLRAKQDEMKYE